MSNDQYKYKTSSWQNTSLVCYNSWEMLQPHDVLFKRSSLSKIKLETWTDRSVYLLHTPASTLLGDDKTKKHTKLFSLSQKQQQWKKNCWQTFLQDCEPQHDLLQTEASISFKTRDLKEVTPAVLFGNQKMVLLLPERCWAISKKCLWSWEIQHFHSLPLPWSRKFSLKYAPRMKLNRL